MGMIKPPLIGIGLPGWRAGKESPANARDRRDSVLIPKYRRSSGVGNGNPHQYSCLGNPTGRGWQATVLGVTESQI